MSSIIGERCQTTSLPHSMTPRAPACLCIWVRVFQKRKGEHLRESPVGPGSPILHPGILRRQQAHCPISFRTVDSVAYKKAMLIFYEQNNISAFKKIFIDQFAFAVQTYFWVLMKKCTKNITKPPRRWFFFAVSLKINNFMNSFVGNALRAASYFYF